MYKITSDKSIRSWDEGMPLGNGDIGCLVWGNANGLRFSLDKGDIWDTSGQPSDNPEFNYHNLVNWAADGKIRKISQTFDACYNSPTPTKLPVGAIILNIHSEDEVKSELDMNTAELNMICGNIKINSFVHSGRRVGYILLNSDQIDLSLDIPKFGVLPIKWWQKVTKPSISQSIKHVHYEKYEYQETKIDNISYKYFIQKVNDELSYCAMVGIRSVNGVTNICFTVASTLDGVNYLEKSTDIIAESLNQGYKMSFAEHIKWWKEYWNKSVISIPDKILERGWYIGNYIMGAGSRKGFYPMPLQGLWTADNGELPPWKGDYHHDLNTQLTYFPYTKANRISEGQCFIDYLLNLHEVGVKFSSKFYGVKGLCLPAVMDINGGALGGWAMYSLSPTNMLWLCDIIAKHYDYTLDNELLRNKIYPYFTAVESTIRGLLVEKGGRLYLPISSSSEIHDNTIKSFLRPNSNYDLSLMIKFYRIIVKYSNLLGHSTDEYLSVLSRLDDLAVDKDNVLMIDRNERLRESHRHHSHAMSIYPLRLLDYDVVADKRVIDATIADMERLGTSKWVGYSLAWFAEFYTVQRAGDKAADMLSKFFKYFCLPNGFHINGDYTKQGLSDLTYRPFTLEGNFCAIDALQEMLLYSHDGIIEPLRAIPSGWKELSYDNLRAEGGVLVSLIYINGRIINMRLEATADISYRLKMQFIKDLMDLSEYKTDKDCVIISMKKGDIITFG